MEYLYAALLVFKAGKDITESALTAVLEAAGASVDKSRVKALVAALSGVDIEEALNSAAMAAVPVAGGATAEAVKEEEKEEEEEDEPDEADMGLGGLFG